MKNRLGLLGLLGFLGILGIVTDNRFFLAFFAFLVFFRYFFVIPDELFKQNVQRAATPAFFTGIGVQAITIAVTAFTKDTQQLISGLSLSFSVAMMLFIILLVVAEFKELRNR
jgi:quinol-cytochrome oxidoreductase complex cytochrome b subunit